MRPAGRLIEVQGFRNRASVQPACRADWTISAGFPLVPTLKHRAMFSHSLAAETKPPCQAKSPRAERKRWIVASVLALFLGLAVLFAAGAWSLVNLYRSRVLYSQGLAAAANGDDRLALTCFNAALRNYLPERWRAQIYQSRGSSFQTLGRRDEALVDYTEVVRIDYSHALRLTRPGHTTTLLPSGLVL
jgi:tetratricopeptide (TPR) repeat protein